MKKFIILALLISMTTIITPALTKDNANENIKNQKYEANKEFDNKKYDKIEYKDNFIIAEKNGKKEVFYEKKLLDSSLDDALFIDITINNLNSKYKYSYLLVKKSNKYGLFSETGRQLLNTEYDNIKTDDKKSYIIFQKSGKWGLLHKDKIIYEPVCSSIANKGIYTFVVIDNKKGLYSPYEEKIVLDNEYDSIAIEDKFFILNKEGKFGVVKKDNLEEFIPFSYNEIVKLKSVFKIKRNNKAGLINENGDIIIQPYYDDILKEYSIEGNPAFIFKKYDKMGIFVLKENSIEEILSAKYDDILLKNQDEGIYVVKNKEKFGIHSIFLNKLIVPVKYDEILNCEYEIAPNVISFIVKNKNKKGAYIFFVDNKNNFKSYNNILYADYDEIEPAHNGFIITFENKKGFYHIDKGEIFKTKYDEIKIINKEGLEIITASKEDKTYEKQLSENIYEKSLKSKQKTSKTLQFPILIPFENL